MTSYESIAQDLIEEYLNSPDNSAFGTDEEYMIGDLAEIQKALDKLGYACTFEFDGPIEGHYGIYANLEENDFGEGIANG